MMENFSPKALDTASRQVPEQDLEEILVKVVTPHYGRRGASDMSLRHIGIVYRKELRKLSATADPHLTIIVPLLLSPFLALALARSLLL